jgi:hypothetical protein
MSDNVLQLQKGIPTIYNMRRYRSRLEARWAAFFDLLQWDAHYEPFDLNGYVPDFVINGREHWGDGCDVTTPAIVPILVEVKPVSGPNDQLFVDTLRKIEQSGWQGEALIVSYYFPDDGTDQHIGWMEDGAIATLQQTRRSPATIGFCNSVQSYFDRISGYYPGGSTGVGSDLEEVFCALWNEAGNLVQWRASKETVERDSWHGPTEAAVAIAMLHARKNNSERLKRFLQSLEAKQCIEVCGQCKHLCKQVELRK